MGGANIGRKPVDECQGRSGVQYSVAGLLRVENHGGGEISKLFKKTLGLRIPWLENHGIPIIHIICYILMYFLIGYTCIVTKKDFAYCFLILNSIIKMFSWNRHCVVITTGIMLAWKLTLLKYFVGEVNLVLIICRS